MFGLCDVYKTVCFTSHNTLYSYCANDLGGAANPIMNDGRNFLPVSKGPYTPHAINNATRTFSTLDSDVCLAIFNYNKAF